jgi:hypothetical protein
MAITSRTAIQLASRGSQRKNSSDSKWRRSVTVENVLPDVLNRSLARTSCRYRSRQMTAANVRSKLAT